MGSQQMLHPQTSSLKPPVSSLLLHVCCANCLFDTLAALAASLPEHLPKPAVFFYNPNIQPLIEYRRRRKSALLAAEALGLKLVQPPPAAPDAYAFFMLTDWRAGPAARCLSCHRMRLYRAAQVAKAHGFAGFMSTLQVSGQQQFEAVMQAGREASARAGVKFHDTDLREWHGRGRPPRGFQAYRQQYCGCIFSEHERFVGSRQHLLAGECAASVRE